MSSRTVLSEDLLERRARRAAVYDRENRFFMRISRTYAKPTILLAAMPEEFGGLGLTHVEVCREQRRLARRSHLIRPFEPTIANIYIGLAERARDLAIERVKNKNSVADMTRSMA
jgi:hypothetical protein